MSLRTLQSEITAEARDIFKNRKLRVKDIMEWSTSEIKPEADEVTVLLPRIGVYCTIFKVNDKRKPG